MTQDERRRAVALSVVVPVFNEQANLAELITRTVAACREVTDAWEFILVDDGSVDDSRDLIEQAAREHPGRIVGVLLSRNYGQHAAVMAGFSKSSGDVVVTLDADLQNPPEEIPRLVAAIGEGYDVVGGVREKRDDPWARRIASRITNATMRRITGSEIGDHGCMLRAYRRHIVNSMVRSGERGTFVPVLANMYAHRTTDIPVRQASRKGDDSKYGLWTLVNLQFDLLTSVTTLPLRLLGVLGVLISIGAFLFGVTLIVMRLAFGAEWAADGVFTLFAILFLFVGAQFVAMGLLGEYLARVYLDVRARPQFLVERVVVSPSTAGVPDDAESAEDEGWTVHTVERRKDEASAP